MTDHQENHPYMPPVSEGDRDSYSVLVALGKFWGFIFALPVVLLWIAYEVQQMPLVKRGLWLPTDIVISTVAFAVPAFVILWSGPMWAARFRVARWPIRLLVSLSIGGLCLLTFMATMQVDWGITEKVWWNFTMGDVIPTLMIWLIVSVYLVIEGLTIRSRIQMLIRS